MHCTSSTPSADCPETYASHTKALRTRDDNPLIMHVTCILVAQMPSNGVHSQAPHNEVRDDNHIIATQGVSTKAIA